MKTQLTLEIEYDPAMTDPEGLASALDRLLETACSAPGILEEYGNLQVGGFLVAHNFAAAPMATKRKRYVLYDFDSDDLATTNVYHSYREAAEDASQLDNVIILTLPFEMPTE